MNEIEKQYREGSLAGRAQTAVTAICGKIEAELAGGNLSGFLPTPADVGAVVAFVASPLSRSINGDVIACAGGAKTAIYI